MKQKSFLLLLISSIAVLTFSCKKNVDTEFKSSTDLNIPTAKSLASLNSGFSRAFSINNSGAIAGSARNSEGKSVAFVLKNSSLWMSDEEVRPNGLPEIKFAINEPGDIVGSKVSGTGIVPLLWKQGQSYELQNLPGYQYGEVFDINNAGQMVGECLNGNFVSPASYRAVLFSLTGTPVDLGTLGGANASAVNINNLGNIVGFSVTASGESHAFLYKDGVMQDLGTLGGTISNANAINDNDEVVGRSLLANGAIRGFYYKNGVMQDLGTLGGAASVAFDINNKGEIVGFARVPSGAAHAFLYKNGVMQDLGVLDGIESRAYGINNRGDIVGQYTKADGSVHAFLYKDGQMFAL
jgi:probable HAF family extracellular repeat protein